MDNAELLPRTTPATAEEIRRRALERLNAPRVRQAMTLGVLICVTAAVLGLLAGDMIFLIFFPETAMSEETADSVLLYVCGAILAFLFAAPAAEGCRAMTCRICGGQVPDLRDLFAPMSSLRGLLRAYSSAFLTILRPGLAVVLAGIYFIFPQSLIGAHRGDIGTVVTVIGVMLALFWLWISRDLWMIPVLNARETTPTAEERKAARTALDSASVRKLSRRLRWSYMGLVLLSLLLVCVPFVFHTVPLTTLSAEYLIRELLPSHIQTNQTENY